MSKRRVVVTGLGLVTPLGLNVADSWSAVKAGRSGVALVNYEGLETSTCKIAASVKNFDPTLSMPAKLARKTDIFIQYGIAAAKQAIADAGFDIGSTALQKGGVAVGSGIGGLPFVVEADQTFTKGGARRVSPMFIPGTLINMLSGHISIEYGMRGPNFAVVTACTTGAHNIGMAARMIANDEIDLMIAGGSEMATCGLGIVGFNAMRALSTRNDAPEKASRPWDKDRDGFVMGDGAGVLVLEEYEHAKARGATIYAELSGFGMSADAYHMTMPDGEGAVASVEKALRDAKLNPGDIDYINAHATSTPTGDPVELMLVKRVFANHLDNLAMSSTKSMTGHLLGAAGAVEAIFSILAIRDNIAPPTINLDTPDDAAEGINLVAHHAQDKKINVVLSNSFGFGGTNGSLIFSRV